MQADDEFKDELKEVSFSLSNKRTFSTPEGYFEQLPDRVLERWKSEREYSLPGTISIRSMIATAAVITGVCFGVAWWTNQTMYGQTKSEISSDDAYHYIIEHMDDFAPMILESGPLADEYNAAIPPPTVLEEYLLEEMEDEDFENVF